MRLGCVFSDGVVAFDQENQVSGKVVQPDAFQLRGFDSDRGLGEGLGKDFSAARIPGIGAFVEDTQIG